MYGNHASINYVFGQLGGHQNTRNVNPYSTTNIKTQGAQIRYDSKGTILNYTTAVAVHLTMRA